MNRVKGLTMYRVAIFDDTKDELEALVGLTERYLEREHIDFRIDQFSSSGKLRDAWNKGSRWNLLMLDILENGPAGIFLAEELRRLGEEADIVFTTSCADYALEGYRAYPVNYLIKPIDSLLLFPVLERCLVGRGNMKMLTLHTEEGGITAVRQKEIFYIEIFRRELVVHCREKIVTGKGSLASILEQLPENRFYRCQRSFIVNLEAVSAVRKYDYVLKNERRVPIAMRSYREACQKWLDYLTCSSDSHDGEKKAEAEESGLQNG